MSVRKLEFHSTFIIQHSTFNIQNQKSYDRIKRNLQMGKHG